MLGTARATNLIRASIKNGSLPITKKFTTTWGDRLDALAGTVYGEGRYWWVLAAASDIGWGMQIPPGTVIIVPDLRAVERLIS
jgi:nucleoid-associated protein YgaU